MKNKTHYECLGVEESASASAIKTGYRQASKDWHLANHGKKEVDRSEMEAISEAYKILGDPSSRKEYDQELSANPRVEKKEDAALGALRMEPQTDGQEGSSKRKIIVIAGILVALAVGTGAILTSVGEADASKQSASEPRASTNSAPAKQAVPLPAKEQEAEPPAIKEAVPVVESTPPASVVDPTKEQKAKEDKIKEDKAKEQKAKEDKAKEDKAKEQKAKEDKAKEDKEQEQKAKEDKAKEDKAKELKAKEDVKNTTPVAPAVQAPPVAAPAPSNVPTPPSGPRTMEAKTICPQQAAPLMPSGYSSTLIESTVVAKVTVVDGSVKEVQILSGHRPYHNAVRKAISSYHCKKEPGDVSFTQEFHFVPE